MGDIVSSVRDITAAPVSVTSAYARTGGVSSRCGTVWAREKMVIVEVLCADKRTCRILGTEEYVTFATMFLRPAAVRDPVDEGLARFLKPEESTAVEDSLEAVNSHTALALEAVGSEGAKLIVKERMLQCAKYSAEHDDAHSPDAFVNAAIVYAAATSNAVNVVSQEIPIKHKTRIQQLYTAGAFLAAEIDRLLRKGYEA